MLFNLINQHRARQRTPGRMIWHDSGASMAKKHVNDMVSLNYFGAVSPSGVGIDNRLVSSTPRIDFSGWGVILSQGSNYAATILQSNIDANYVPIINSTTYTHIGIGYNPAHGGMWVEVYLQKPVPSTLRGIATVAAFARMRVFAVARILANAATGKASGRR